MAYVSLYRKYRPQSFDEVVGQRHVTATLANAITEDRLHHAYLLTGPRGTGKTSVARILAKAINCEQGPTAQPCQVCEVCLSVTDGSAVDVVELDMASHGGVDDARELRERALFAPARVRRKVYILDEVHMASSAAFNALLKLLEEPPGHVLFAMATTDPQKVLPTIMSRVQRLDLRRVAGSEVAEHVRRIGALEEVVIADAAVEAIVRAGDGSVRDTLSILEQVLAFAGREVTAEHVVELLGHTPADRVFDAVTRLAEADLAGLLALVDELLADGLDLRRFALDLVGHLRDLLVLQTVPDRPDLVEASPDHRTRLLGQAPLLPRERLVRAIDILGETIAEMRRGPARLPLELALAKLALPTPAAPGTTPAAEEVASTVEEDAETAEGERPGEPEEVGATAEPAGSAREEEHAAPGQHPLGIDDVRERWPQILDVVKQASPRVHAILGPATPAAVDDRALVLGYPQRYAQFHAEQAESPENASLIARAVEQVLGTEVAVRSEVTEVGSARPEQEAGATVDAREAEEVREAEVDPPTVGDPDAAAERAAALLRDELGAEAVDDAEADR